MVLTVSSIVGLGKSYRMFKLYDIVPRVRRINKYNKLINPKSLSIIWFGYEGCNLSLEILCNGHSYILCRKFLNRNNNAVLHFYHFVSFKVHHRSVYSCMLFTLP